MNVRLAYEAINQICGAPQIAACVVYGWCIMGRDCVQKVVKPRSTVPGSYAHGHWGPPLCSQNVWIINATGEWTRLSSITVQRLRVIKHSLESPRQSITTPYDMCASSSHTININTVRYVCKFLIYDQYQHRAICASSSHTININTVRYVQVPHIRSNINTVRYVQVPHVRSISTPCDMCKFLTYDQISTLRYVCKFLAYNQISTPCELCKFLFEI